ncbi:MAG: alanine:cation symporter family protein [Bacteroides sp.]|nr:alanine:cation symporter family protein [Bacteroides sp.]
MELFSLIINETNHILWTYILIAMLLGCAIWFSIKTKFVQFRMLGEMIRLLGDSTAKINGHEKHISSFQAFTISLASRVGTGNLAGVATAVTVGGPGAIFWMWIIALLGSSSAFVESSLAQLFKIKGKHSYIGGPAYYMEKGLKKRWMGVLFAVLITITFGFAFNSVQSNTMSAALESAFAVKPWMSGTVISVLTLFIIFGGVHRIATISSIIVPVMAVGYILLALFIVLSNIDRIPTVIGQIIGNAFGWHQAIGGGIGAALMQGIKRGLFSNEAGMGSAPNAAATAHVTHPAKQGFIQALGVFTDTLLICSCTAFIILFSEEHIGNGLDGIQLTQAALTNEVGSIGGIYVAIATLFFAYSSILGNYYYGEANIRFFTSRRWPIQLYRLLVGGMVMFGSLASLNLVWSLADVAMALMSICNLIAIFLLGKYAFRLLDDYLEQKRKGIKSPVFHKERMKDIEQDLECW